MSYNPKFSDESIPSNPPRVKESIVVEGRDDSAVVRQAVSADTIITNGFTIRRPVARRIIEAARQNGVIVLTDPDHAGETIRRKIEELLDEEHRFARQSPEQAEGLQRTPEQEKKSRNGTGMNIFRVPQLKHARLLVEEALKDGDIGVENATPVVVFEALRKAGATFLDADETGVSNASDRELSPFSSTDLLALGLVGAGSKSRRKKVGRYFGVGYANAKQLAKRLAVRGIGFDQVRAFLDQ